MSQGAGEIFWYDWLLKGALTVLTLSAGFQGGEVTPLFSIGASLGAVLAPAFGLSAASGAALGYASVFASASNTLIGADIDRRRGVRPAGPSILRGQRGVFQAVQPRAFHLSPTRK